MSRAEPDLLEAYGEGPGAVQRVGDISLLIEEESPGSARGLLPSAASPSQCKTNAQGATRTESGDFEQETRGLTTEEAEELQKTIGFNGEPALLKLSYWYSRSTE